MVYTEINLTTINQSQLKYVDTREYVLVDECLAYCDTILQQNFMLKLFITAAIILTFVCYFYFVVYKKECYKKEWLLIKEKIKELKEKTK